ncbi:MAG TPA: futalosine hydrolase [Planctomycetota bacterium]|nr:futalosine hydrolase [Planctomycetota bacterium]
MADPALRSRRAPGSPGPPRVLFLAAVEQEILPLEAWLARLGDILEARLEVTGAGKASAASAAALAIAEFRPAIAVQVGCAGAYPASGMPVGGVVVSDLEILADEGVLAPEGFLDLSHLALPAASDRGRPVFNEVPTFRPRFETWQGLLERVGGRFQVRAGRTATVSTGSGTDERAREIASRWDPLSESMEGAAAAIAALRQGCPFLEVRGISNVVGQRDRASWRIEEASEHAAETAAHILELEIAIGGFQ